MRREDSEVDNTNYSAAISACENASEWANALDLLSSMQRQGMELDTIRNSAAINACEKTSEWTHALDLLD